jgi:hypothetical protein
MQAFHAFDKVVGKAGLVVLAKGRKLGVEMLVQFLLVFDHLGQSRRQIKRPGQLPGGSQAPETLINSRLHGIAQIDDHFVGLKCAMPEIGFVFGNHAQGARFLRFQHVNPKFLKLAAYLGRGVVFGYIQASFIALKANGHEGDCDVKLLCFRAVKQRRMVPQFDFVDTARHWSDVHPSNVIVNKTVELVVQRFAPFPARPIWGRQEETHRPRHR